VNTYLPHLIELRTRIIRSIVAIFSLFLILFSIDKHLYTFIAKPLLQQLPIGSALIATEVTATFIAPMKLAFILSLFLSMPYLFYQLWSFVSPGLYRKEKQKALPFLITSILLFYTGVLFAYAIICPLALAFFAKCAPIGVMVMTDIQAYLDFVLTVLFAGGIAFEVPIITLACIKFRLISITQLEYLRPYIIVGAFILGMLLTPPDVVSQILLALPMWGLFEAGLFIAKCSQKKISCTN